MIRALPLVLLVVAACRDESVPMPLPLPQEDWAASSSSGADAGCVTDWVCCGPRGEQCPVDDGDGAPMHCLEGEVTSQPGSCP